MINLIPPEARKNVMIEYWVRALSVGLVLVSMALLVVAVLLLPPYVLLNGLVTTKQMSLDETEEKTREYDISAKSLVQATTLARQVVEGDRAPSFTNLVAVIEAARDPELVAIEGYDFSLVGEQAAPVIVTGNATTRQSLADFRDRLVVSDDIMAVDLPLSNLAKDRDLPFSLTVTFASTTTP